MRKCGRERRLEKDIRLGLSNTQEQLDSAIDTALREHGTLDDPAWLLGAITEVGIFVEQHHQLRHCTAKRPIPQIA